MEELLEKEQIVSVVPQNFRNAIKGRVLNYDEKFFEIEASREPKGILINNLTEFYSQTRHGVLYFSSDVAEVKGNILKVYAPTKHRFLQRRQFTRINFTQEVELASEKNSYSVSIRDLSAGGMKVLSKEIIDIDRDYKIKIAISDEREINCLFQPIRISKNDEGIYTLSGRFKNLSNIDRMTIIQLCMKKKIENISK